MGLPRPGSRKWPESKDEGRDNEFVDSGSYGGIAQTTTRNVLSRNKRDEENEVTTYQIVVNFVVEPKNAINVRC